MTVPYPGPRPAPFEFPFDAAEALVDAIEGLIGDIGVMQGVHERAAEEARTDFRGRARTDFDNDLQESMDTWDSRKQTLDAQAEAVRSQIGEAGNRVEAREAERSQWDRDMQRWREDQARQRSESGTGG